MFKKSHNLGDKTPKNQTKDRAAKAEPVAGQPASAAKKTAAPAPAKEAKQS